jgi:opacity protein-like surface antigen
MLRYKTLVVVVSMFIFIKPVIGQSIGQYPPFTRWYQNPLGISPLSLHTGNGLWIPIVTATAVMLLVPNDTTMVDRISYYNESGVSKGYMDRHTSIFQNNTGVLVRVRRWMSIGGEVTIYHPRDEVNNTWGFGLRPFIRFYVVERDRWRIYFESGAGLIYFLNEYPQPSGFFGDTRTGTRLNGSPKYGVGTEVNIGQTVSIVAGVRHVHISNGNHPDADRNPGHDGNGFTIGVLYTPHR